MKLRFVAGLVLLCSLVTAGGKAGTLTFSSLSVKSSGRSFVYQVSDSHLTVNGCAADSEVFHTLLSHLASSISGQDIAFTPEEAPLLEVTLSTSEGTHEINYYKDKSDSSFVYVCVITPFDEEYTTTEAWRIGTILLACEGSRLQGQQEQPPAFSPETQVSALPASTPVPSILP